MNRYLVWIIIGAGLLGLALIKSCGHTPCQAGASIMCGPQ
jgi:hypothetical protein